MNFFLLNDSFYLVDLPGYGFARASKQEKEKWSGMIEGYLQKSENLRHVVQLVDIRHAPTEEDQMMTNYLRHYEIPFTRRRNESGQTLQSAAQPVDSGNLSNAGCSAMGNHRLFVRGRNGA